MSAIEIRGIDHVVLRVRDLDARDPLLLRVLGCREERRVDALGLVQLRAGSALIDLVDVAGALGPPRRRAPRGIRPQHGPLRAPARAFDEPALRAELAAAGIEAGEVANDMARRAWALALRPRSGWQRRRAQGSRKNSRQR
jgi:catechol 2,3-dioxygenase-like lactoylglutathione lyase family enzyme